MGWIKRLLIVVVAAVLYLPAAFGALILVAVLNWVFALKMCDFACGPAPDRPEQIALMIEIVVFVLGVLAGLVWVFLGTSRAPGGPSGRRRKTESPHGGARRDDIKSRVDAVISVLLDARKLLALPGNDFAWSHWKDARAALTEIDGFVEALRQGAVPQGLEFLFAPTGSIQEVSLSSGWGEEFLELAERFDTAFAAFRAASSSASKASLSPRLTAKISKMFTPIEAEKAAALLTTEASGIERVRCAVLKLSDGSLEKLAKALQFAKADWRDALVAAGFGHDLNSHEAWLSE